MKTQFLLLPWLLVACAANSAASTAARAGPEPARVDLSKFQPGEQRGSIAARIGEPELVLALDNGDKCEVYSAYITDKTLHHGFAPESGRGLNPEQTILIPINSIRLDQLNAANLNHRVVLGAGVNPADKPTLVAMGTIPPDRLNAINLKDLVVLCYRSGQLDHVMAKPCLSAACTVPVR